MPGSRDSFVRMPSALLDLIPLLFVRLGGGCTGLLMWLTIMVTQTGW